MVGGFWAPMGYGTAAYGVGAGGGGGVAAGGTGVYGVGGTGTSLSGSVGMALWVLCGASGRRSGALATRASRQPSGDGMRADA